MFSFPWTWFKQKLNQLVVFLLNFLYTKTSLFTECLANANTEARAARMRDHSRHLYQSKARPDPDHVPSADDHGIIIACVSSALRSTCVCVCVCVFCFSPQPRPPIRITTIIVNRQPANSWRSVGVVHEAPTTRNYFCAFSVFLNRLKKGNKQIFRNKIRYRMNCSIHTHHHTTNTPTPATSFWLLVIFLSS